MKNRKSLLSLYSAKNNYIWKLFHIYIYVFSRRFYSKRLTVHSGYIYIFCQHVCSLGIEPTTFCAANAMLYHRDTCIFHYTHTCHHLANDIYVY